MVFKELLLRGRSKNKELIRIRAAYEKHKSRNNSSIYKTIMGKITAVGVLEGREQISSSLCD